MNKASVSKELNAKHAKILEGLLKLPKNRICADCQSKAKMGKCESGDLYLYAMFRNSSKPWRAHFKALGNEKANAYWEKELSPAEDRSGIENFIRAKYEGKKWVAKGSKQPTPETVEIGTTFNKLAEGRPTKIKKLRRLSLDEAVLSRLLTEDAHPVTRVTKSRTVSIDFSDKLTGSSLPKGPAPTIGTSNATSSKRSGEPNLFNLPHVHVAKPKCVIVPSAARWETFDCKNHMIIIFFDRNFDVGVNLKQNGLMPKQ